MDKTTTQLEVLKEIGNIGAGHAATALSRMLQTTIKMSVPRVWLVPLNGLDQVFGAMDALHIVVYLKIEGEAPGKAIFVFNTSCAQSMAEALLCQDVEADILGSELCQSALKEVGNILVGSFIMALTEFSRVKLSSSVPALGMDMIGAVIAAILIDEGSLCDQVIIFDTKMSGLTEMEGKFLFIPNEGSLEKLVKVFVP